VVHGTAGVVGAEQAVVVVVRPVCGAGGQESVELGQLRKELVHRAATATSTWAWAFTFLAPSRTKDAGKREHSRGSSGKKRAACGGAADQQQKESALTPAQEVQLRRDGQQCEHCVRLQLSWEEGPVPHKRMVRNCQKLLEVYC
jgi:hypothetical protein